MDESLQGVSDVFVFLFLWFLVVFYLFSLVSGLFFLIYRCSLFCCF